VDTEEYKRLVGRKANRGVLVDGPAGQLDAWFGRAAVALPGEGWPSDEDGPMLSLIQLNVAQLPYVPADLADIAFITVFITQGNLPDGEPNGEGWLLRAYPTLEGLELLEVPEGLESIRPFPIRWEPIEEDYPSLDDAIRLNFPEEFAEEFTPIDELKVGGWPSLIQSEIYWAAHNRHPAYPEYVFQIPSINDFMWGDAGYGYFGRGDVAARDEWAMAWQCY